MSTSDDSESDPKTVPEAAVAAEDTHCVSPKATPPELARRRFLARASVGLVVVGGAALSAPGIAFVVAPLLSDGPREWRPVGKVESFKVGTTTNVVFVDATPLPWAGVTAKTGAWLRRASEEEFVAFSVNCAHLGCPVRWLQEANLFMCPCHGGVYYADGRVAAGPPPRPLSRYPVRIRDGQVEIRTQPIPIG
jgi:menaquinol-cytochrome c reductase iron-sulfur subunit